MLFIIEIIIWMSESVDEVIERFRSRRDRDMIKERMAERNLLFERATQNYLHSIQREIETIQRTQKLTESRNQEFRESINNLYKRYEKGSEKLQQVIKRTNMEKINYNNYLLKVYPHNYTKQRQALLEENLRLQNMLQQLKPDLTIEDQIPVLDAGPDDQEDFQAQLDRYHLKEDHHHEPQRPAQVRVEKPQRSNPSQETDHLSQFLLNPQKP